MIVILWYGTDIWLVLLLPTFKSVVNFMLNKLRLKRFEVMVPKANRKFTTFQIRRDWKSNVVLMTFMLYIHKIYLSFFVLVFRRQFRNSSTSDTLVWQDDNRRGGRRSLLARGQSHHRWCSRLLGRRWQSWHPLSCRCSLSEILL